MTIGGYCHRFSDRLHGSSIRVILCVYLRVERAVERTAAGGSTDWSGDGDE